MPRQALFWLCELSSDQIFYRYVEGAEYGSETVYLYQYIECVRTCTWEGLYSDKSGRPSGTQYCLWTEQAESGVVYSEYARFPYVIYRPTGVYGPREADYYLMAKSIQKHVDFSVGFRRQDLTFVYVKDIVQAIFLGIEKK